MEQIKDLAKFYDPTTGIIFNAPMSSIVSANHIYNKRLEALTTMMSTMEKDFRRYRRAVAPNNRLKRLGVPMRRKGV